MRRRPPLAATGPDPRLDAEAGWLTRAGSGDAAAFADLYDVMSSRVYGTVLVLVGDPVQAEETTLAVFLDVWRTSASFDPGRGSAASWVMTIAHRHAVLCARARRDDGPRPRGSADTASGTTAPRPRRSTVVAALDELPAAQRHAVDLAWFDGHPSADTAPPEHRPALLRSALLALRDRLAGVDAESA
ncbi:sigma factor [Nocardioides hwasunensis]|uniref:RNA polymerase subunit sigma n=1 Tax=Nocardioides hwasunensis TaxID=397258 RepID=A0ABR8MG29_9ACTN|nr:sigma factor [Nocardioides hwasunensis]MBD3914912.1 RNA polymerase subunit sigma [Nocardioides hwasunensis]